MSVIFIKPAEQVAAELLRVTRPGGRIVLSAWTPVGPIHEIMGLVDDAMASVLPPDDGPVSPTNWRDPAVRERLFSPATVTVRPERLAFVAPSALAWATDQYENHPGWAGRPGGPRGGSLDEWGVLDRIIEVPMISTA